MKPYLSTLTVCILTMLVIVMGSIPPASARSTTCAPYTANDIEFIRQTFERDHPRLATVFRPAIAAQNPILSSDPVLSYFDTLRFLNSYEDGHSSLPMPECISNKIADLLIFPLAVMIREGRIYVDQIDAQLPVGAEIKSINGQSARNILEKLSEYASLDGEYNDSRGQALEQEFSLFLWAELGETTEFQTTFLAIGDTRRKTLTIKAQPVHTVWPRLSEKVSTGLTHQICDGDTCNVSLNVSGKSILYSRLVDLFHSLGGSEQNTSQFADDIVSSAHRDSADNIIIDLRGNPGGVREFTNIIASRMVKAPFRQRQFSFIRNTNWDNSVGLLNKQEVKDFISDYRHAASCRQGACLFNDPLAHYMKPTRKTFRGNIWILIDGATFSAATEIVYTLKTHADKVRIIGSESAGGAVYHSGDLRGIFELPNSGYRFNFSIAGIYHDIHKSAHAARGGIVPDVAISLTGKDLLQHHDSVLQYVLGEIAMP